MKYEDYETKVNGMVANADTAPTVAAELLEELKVDTVALESAAEKINELEARVADLQETNIKLFMQIGGQDEAAEEEEEKTGAEAVDEFWDNLEKEEK